MGRLAETAPMCGAKPMSAPDEDLYSTEITPSQALWLRDNWIARGNPHLLWAIYQSPLEYPGKFIARPWSVKDAAPFRSHLVADTLAEIQGKMPPGLVRIGGIDKDDPVIVETWM